MAVARVSGAGVELAYEESGAGRPVLLVHGTGLTRLAWRETVEALAGSVRAIAYDRRAYGDSEAPEPYLATTIEEQAEDAAALLRALGATPAVVCGHSAGAVVALDLLLRHSALVRGAVLVEPPLLALAPTGAEMLSELREEIEDAARERGPGAAVEALLTGRAGEGVLDVLGPERAEAARASVRGALADFGAVTGWELRRRALRAIEQPVLVLSGARSREIYREVAALLADLVGSAELRELDAGWAGPLEDPVGVAAAIRDVADV